jgi:hypothetical protein
MKREEKETQTLHSGPISNRLVRPISLRLYEQCCPKNEQREGPDSVKMAGNVRINIVSNLDRVGIEVAL